MLQEQEIGRELFGYKKDDVDRYLADLHRTLRLTKEENEQLQNELKEANDKVASFEAMSKALKQTMNNAEKTASGLVDQARKEADIILAKANMEAGNILDAANKQRQAVDKGLKALEKADSDLEAEIRSMLTSYMNLVENITLDKMVEGALSSSSSNNGDSKPSASEPAATAIPEKPPVVLSEDAKKALDDSLSELSTIDNVGAVWAFDDGGNIVSSFNHLGIDLNEITLSLVTLDAWAERFEANLANVKTNLIFIEFNKLLLFINPVTDAITSCVLTSINAPIGKVFQSLDAQIPGLRKVLK